MVVAGDRQSPVRGRISPGGEPRGAGELTAPSDLAPLAAAPYHYQGGPQQPHIPVV